MATYTDVINQLLDPQIHQVIGSTPSSLVDYIKKTNLKGNAADGVKLAAACVFASAVNKVTTENFLISPEMVALRGIILQSFSIGGKSNMTALTLLGHCVLTTNKLDSVRFVQEFRNKMGQSNLWAADLKSGTLSDKQREILTEKKKKISEIDAKLFGSGYWKYIGIDRMAMTHEEAVFWRESSMRVDTVSGSDRRAVTDLLPGTNKGKRLASPPRSPVEAPPVSPPFSPSVIKTDNTTWHVQVTPEEVLPVSAVAADYYLAVNKGNVQALIDSLRRNGKAQFDSRYSMASAADPSRRGVGGSSVVG